MKQRDERRLSAYRDGELRTSARRRVDRQLQEDAEATRYLQQLTGVRTLVREAWNEGPRGPAPEALLRAVGPALDRVDRERAARPGWRKLVERALAALRPLPVPALVGTAATALMLVVLGRPMLESGSPAPVPPLPRLGSPAAIYELDQKNHAFLVYQVEGGDTIIWLLPEERHASVTLGGSDPRA